MVLPPISASSGTVVLLQILYVAYMWVPSDGDIHLSSPKKLANEPMGQVGSDNGQEY